MSQDDTRDLGTPQAGKVAPEAGMLVYPAALGHTPESAHLGHAHGRSVAVLATIWSLQPHRRAACASRPSFYNVDRVSKSEGLDGLPSDYPSCGRCRS